MGEVYQLAGKHSTYDLYILGLPYSDPSKLVTVLNQQIAFCLISTAAEPLEAVFRAEIVSYVN